MTSPRDRRLGDPWQLPVAVVAALLVGWVITALFSAQPGLAFRQLLTGGLPELRQVDGTWTLVRLTRFGQVLEETVTLCLLGLAVAIPFRAGQISLGVDGQMFLAALAGAAVALGWPGPAVLALPLAVVAGVAVGFAWGAVPGWLKTRFGAHEIVTTLMLNIVAIQFYRLAVSRWMRDPDAGFISTPVLPAAAQFSVWIPHTHVTSMLLAVPLCCWLAWLLLMRTTLGYEIRALGSAPAFARRMGMPVRRAVVLSMACGGAFAGLGGLHIGHALLTKLPVDLSPGLGFEGLVVALMARLRPEAVPFAAFLYAYLRTGAQVMERTTDVSREIVLVIEAFIILFVLADRLMPWLRARLPQRRAPAPAMPPAVPTENRP